jgi:NitT/TauT family transport system permease protein
VSEAAVSAAPPAAAPARRARPPLALITSPLLAVVLIGLWHLYVVRSGVSAFILPSPVAVWGALLELLATPSTWTHTLATVQAS